MYIVIESPRDAESIGSCLGLRYGQRTGRGWPWTELKEGTRGVLGLFRLGITLLRSLGRAFYRNAKSEIITNTIRLDTDYALGEPGCNAVKIFDIW